MTQSDRDRTAAADPRLDSRAQRAVRGAGRLALLLALPTGLLGGCSGGADADAAASSLFFLDGASVANGQTWQINRPISFRFSQAVDFSTVNPNTIFIAEPSGTPAVGEFQQDPGDAALVVFVPRCPTKPDLSDAGLQPDGAAYRIRISDQSTGAGSVMSVTGRGIEIAQTIDFSTPPSLNPLDLFIDIVPGPPTPVNGSYDENGDAVGTRLVYLSTGESIPFQVDETGQGNLGDTLVPLNLYSDLSTRTAVIVELNQAVNPTDQNVNPSRIQLQFREGMDWLSISTEVELTANCTESGSTVFLRPIGLLPQNREIRVWLGPEFEDLVGDRNILPLDEFAIMTSATAVDGSGAPVDFADEVLEEFLLGGPDSLQDTDAVSATPVAFWGGGKLEAAFAFTGTGGPGGDFDWFLPENTDVVLDTTSTLILGGPEGVPVNSQLVVNGLVNVRNMKVPATSRILIQGTPTATFLVSGQLTVDGVISANGMNAQPIIQPNMPSVPAPGAAGTAGGGDGGIGSFLTNQVTSRGGAGRGAFGEQGAGGQGGESGWNPSLQGNGIFRRAAGGGGGRFGLDELIFIGAIDEFCNNQTRIGLDAESGFPGSEFANAAERPGMIMPWGGMPGPGPFSGDPGDEFWGTMLANYASPSASIVEGELPSPWAGSGGGAGGDATLASAYPPPTLNPNDNNRGAGGGGGGGSLTILCLGDVVFGPAGRIEANGGYGNGGENTISTNRIGGGSGGGSGGHIVIQTGSQIDLSAIPNNTVAILARGGQGGVGADNIGGANVGETTQGSDGVHVGVTGPNDVTDNPFIPEGPPNCPAGVGVVRAAGGDGGPGVIQLHVGELPADITNPGNGPDSAITDAVVPAPVGYDSVDEEWVDQLIPLFGRFSQAQSKWIPLGGVAVDPDSDELQSIEFLFDGTDPDDGLIVAPSGDVEDLDPVLAPPAPVEAPGLPEISVEDPRVLIIAAAGFAGDDAIYRRNPALLRRFDLTVSDESFPVESAALSPDGLTISLTVPAVGPTLPSAGQVVLRPRYFRVITNDVTDVLPSSSEVTISFQAAPVDPVTGEPDTAGILPSPTTWATSVSELNDAEENPTLRFYRFRVEFEIAVGQTDLSFDTPRPSLQFFRTPFRF